MFNCDKRTKPLTFMLLGMKSKKPCRIVRVTVYDKEVEFYPCNPLVN